MRAFSFKARNIGDEKYLTYTMGDDCELDEDVLDYVEDQTVTELVNVIYEEDDDYDYLTYDISGKTSLADLTASEAKSELVLNVIKNIASEMIDLKEQAVPLAYLLLNRNFMYVDTETYKVQFICLPIESTASVAVEFKGFVRQLLANMKYDVAENLGYVGQLLTYINGDTFTLRGLAGLAEALMDESGIQYEATADIDADGVEVVSTAEATPAKEESVSNFMNDTEEAPLPEIGDDDEEADVSEAEADDEELESILPAGMKPVAEETTESTEEAPAETPKEAQVETPAETSETPAAEEAKPTSAFKGATSVKETDVDLVKERVRKIMGEGKTAQPSAITPDVTTPMASIKKKNVIKVNRAAIIQNVAAEQEEELAAQEAEAVAAAQEVEAVAQAEAPATEEEITVSMADGEVTSNSVLSKTISEPPKPSVLNAPKAVPYLIRVNTNERIMLNKPTFKIGKASRGVDYTVDGNGAISRVHAIITQRDDVCYIKDNKSTNHTYVNNVPIEDGVEEILTHESLVRLGDEEFTFKIR